MPTPEEIERLNALLDAGALERPAPVNAHTFREVVSTSSDPVVLACDDGHEYFVKSENAGRVIVNDHVVAHLGQKLGAPVGEPQIIYVPQELKDSEPKMQHVVAGLAHGTRVIPNCVDHRIVHFTWLTENKTRFALLAVLYGWCQAGDRQWLYNTFDPQLVHSVDHGHFFPGGPEWSVDTLNGAGDPELDVIIVNDCGLTEGEQRAALDTLQNNIGEDDVVAAVAACPDEWAFTRDERVALSSFLIQRRNLLLRALVEI